MLKTIFMKMTFIASLSFVLLSGQLTLATTFDDVKPAPKYESKVFEPALIDGKSILALTGDELSDNSSGSYANIAEGRANQICVNYGYELAIIKDDDLHSLSRGPTPTATDKENLWSIESGRLNLVSFATVAEHKSIVFLTWPGASFQRITCLKQVK